MRRQRRQQQDAANATLRAAQSRERMRNNSHGQQQQQQQQPDSDGQEGDGAATGRQVFRMAQGRDMRWDGMTGEPTLRPTGFSGQVKPAEYAQGLKTGGKMSSASSSALEKLRNAQGSFGDKVRKMRGGDGAGAGVATQPPVSPVLEPQPEPEPEPEPELVAAAPALAAPTAPTAPTAPATPPASSPTTAVRPPRKSSLNATPARPEWKGASGRTALVAPVQDTPQTPPLHIPRKSSKRERNANRSQGARGSPGAPGGLLPLSPISPSGSETSFNRADPATTKLLPPQQATHGTTSDGQDPEEGSAAPPDHAQPETPTAPASINLDHAKSVRRKPTPSAAAAAAAAAATSSAPGTAPATPIYPPRHESHMSTASSLYSTLDTRTVPHSLGASNITVSTHLPSSSPTPAGLEATTTPAEDNWVQPSSRFSVTTYATSAHTRSPNQSVDVDAPPMPSPPRNDYSSQSPQSKVDSPDPGAYMSSPYTSPVAELRKAAALGRDNTPSYLRSGGGAWQSSVAPSVLSGRPGSVASTTKALPLAPPEMLTVNDRVGHLNARLESLANRRININRSIMQMTELMPTDNLMASDAVLRKRETEKQKVEVLRDELAEVQREEYELGLKLHRAYKRLDRDAEYEPTGLWVRRLTG